VRNVSISKAPSTMSNTLTNDIVVCAAQRICSEHAIMMVAQRLGFMYLCHRGVGGGRVTQWAILKEQEECIRKATHHQARTTQHISTVSSTGVQQTRQDIRHARTRP
jgi:hypothetical protein